MVSGRNEQVFLFVVWDDKVNGESTVSTKICLSNFGGAYHLSSPISVPTPQEGFFAGWPEKSLP